MAIEIVPLTKADIPAAVECVQKAFADDPFFRWAFNEPSKVWKFVVKEGGKEGEKKGDTDPASQGLWEEESNILYSTSSSTSADMFELYSLTFNEMQPL
jgi:hypothetical protein